MLMFAILISVRSGRDDCERFSGFSLYENDNAGYFSFKSPPWKHSTYSNTPKTGRCLTKFSRALLNKATTLIHDTIVHKLHCLKVFNTESCNSKDLMLVFTIYLNCQICAKISVEFWNGISTLNLNKLRPLPSIIKLMVNIERSTKRLASNWSRWWIRVIRVHKNLFSWFVNYIFHLMLTDYSSSTRVHFKYYIKWLICLIITKYVSLLHSNQRKLSYIYTNLLKLKLCLDGHS